MVEERRTTPIVRKDSPPPIKRQLTPTAGAAGGGAGNGARQLTPPAPMQKTTPPPRRLTPTAVEETKNDSNPKAGGMMQTAEMLVCDISDDDIWVPDLYAVRAASKVLEAPKPPPPVRRPKLKTKVDPTRSTIGTSFEDVLKDQIERARAKGDDKRVAKAVNAAAVAGVDLRDVAVRKARRALIEKRRYERYLQGWYWITPMLDARAALRRVRACESVEATTQAVADVYAFIRAAMPYDRQGRSEIELLSHLGTSERELRDLPWSLKALEASIFAPDRSGAIGRLASDEPAEHTTRPHNCVHSQLTGKKDRVILVTHIHVKRLLLAGEVQIVSPKTKIIYPEDDKYGDMPFLSLPDDRHVRQEMIDGKSVTVMGAGQTAYLAHLEDWSDWVYYPVTVDHRVSEVPLVGSSKTGFQGPDQLAEQSKPTMKEVLGHLLAKDFMHRYEADQKLLYDAYIAWARAQLIEEMRL